MTRTRIAIVLAGLALATPAAAADQGYFDCFHLSADQRAWFGSSGISRCCNLADGMPTHFEERPEGVFIPPFSEGKPLADACRAGMPWAELPQHDDHHTWMLVVDAVILRKNNPMGVGVIWWTNSKENDPATEHTIRCFVGLPKV